MSTTIYQQIHELFLARPEVYAEAWWSKQKRWNYKSVPKELTPNVIKKHCEDTSYPGVGIYPLLDGNLCKWVSADFDVHDDKEKQEVHNALEKIYKIADGNDLHLYQEFSKSGNGIHLWAFFTVPIESWKARKLMMGLIEGAGAMNLSSMDRLFPSQDVLHQKSKGIGNLIHLPFSAKFIKHGCYFVDRDGEEYRNSHDDIEAWIDSVELLTPEKVDIILDNWGYLKQKDQSLSIEYDNFDYTYDDDGLEKVMEDPFIVWCRENPTKVDYNSWLGLISNLLPFGESGVKAIHTISSQDTGRYNKKDTDKKIIECDGMKPITYNWLAKNTPFSDEERPNVTYKSPAGAGVKKKGVDSPIFEQWGSYFYKMGSKGNIEISNFTITPKSNVMLDGKIERVFDVLAQKKIITDVQISGDVISSLDKFRRLMSEISTETQFYGNANHLLRLQNYISQRFPEVKEIWGVKDIGLHKAKNETDWTVITQSNAWDLHGHSDNYIYYNTVEKGIAMSPDVMINKKELQNIASNLLQFNEFPIASAIIGWMGAIMVKQRLYKNHAIRFPALSVHGQAGSGKTETGRHLIQRWFSDIGAMYSVGDLTKFVMLKLNGSTNTFPIFLDEYKISMIGEDKVKFISQMVRAIYDQSTASRGRADQTIEEYNMTSPIVVMGEAGFNEPALIERSIDIFMSKSDSSDFLDNFLILKKAPIDRMGNAFLNWTLKMDDDKLYAMFMKEMEGRATDRVDHNIAMVNMGLQLLHDYFAVHGIKFPVELAKQAFTKRQTELVKEHGEVSTAVDNILRAMFTMKQTNVVGEDMIKEIEGGEEVAIDIRGLYPTFKKWCRETDFEYEMLNEKEFTKQVKKMSYYSTAKAVRMSDDGTVYCRILKTDILKRKDIMVDMSEHEILKNVGLITTKGEKQLEIDNITTENYKKGENTPKY